MTALLLAALLAAPGELEALLAKGPVVSVEQDASATGLLEIAAPVDAVWAVLTDFGRYKEFVPRLVGSEVHLRAPGSPRVVSFEIETPGLNTRYTVEYVLDARAHAMDGRQISGDLAGSRWRWELSEAAPGRTRVRYTSRARNFSRVIQALEDEAQTITAGLNVSGVVTMLRALKRRCEG